MVPLLMTLLLSCAAPGAGSGRQLSDPDFIMRDEIDESGSSRTAWDLVNSIRPQWLFTRGISTLSQAVGAETIIIYMDNARLGTPNSMRGVPLGNVQYLQFFSAPEATLRWGGGHLQGAILISTQSL